MAKEELVIDDEYCDGMVMHVYSRGATLNAIIRDYIAAMERVRNRAIKEGEAAEALDAYLVYVKKLDGQLKEISEIIHNQIHDFLIQIDTADQYLF